MYCSEHIWKVYQRVIGFGIVELDKLSNFDLSNEIIKVKWKNGYGDGILLKEVVVVPKAIFESKLLMMVFI